MAETLLAEARMKVVIAIDSFKGCLSSRAAGAAVRRGVLAADPQADVSVAEVADGGEGTLSALLRPNRGELLEATTRDAIGRPITAGFGVFRRDGALRAVVECARTLGPDLVPVDDSLPRRGNSCGMGQQLGLACDTGADEVLVALGGSATTDGGAGLLLALGAKILDPDGAEITAAENPLWRFGSLDVSGIRGLSGTRLTVLSDVTNPLCGPAGAAAVFGPQKGATPEQVTHLDAQLQRWAAALAGGFGVDVAEQPGAGAAGGLGAALLALGAQLEPGFDRIAAETGLAETLRRADLVFTGEGSLDRQSANGKVPGGVAQLVRSIRCQQADPPADPIPADAALPDPTPAEQEIQVEQETPALVVGLAGQVERTAGGTLPLLDAVFSIQSRPRTLAAAMDPRTTAGELEATAFEVTRLLTAARASGPVPPARSPGRSADPV